MARHHHYGVGGVSCHPILREPPRRSVLPTSEEPRFGVGWADGDTVPVHEIHQKVGARVFETPNPVLCHFRRVDTGQIASPPPRHSERRRDVLGTVSCHHPSLSQPTPNRSVAHSGSSLWTQRREAGPTQSCAWRPVRSRLSTKTNPAQRRGGAWAEDPLTRRTRPRRRTSTPCRSSWCAPRPSPPSWRRRGRRCRRRGGRRRAHCSARCGARAGRTCRTRGRTW